MGKDTDPITGKDTNMARRARMAERKKKREAKPAIATVSQTAGLLARMKARNKESINY